MASKAEPRLAAATAAGWRLLAAAALLTILLQLLTSTRHFATAVLIAATVALLLVDAANALKRGRPAGPGEASARERDAVRRGDEASALLDAVTVSLLLLGEDGRIRFANRAARLLAGTKVARLDQIACVGEEAATRILALPVGGRNMLVWVGGLTTPEGGAERIVSMQAVAGELDAVQVGAWHSMTRVLAHEMMNSLTPIASLSESLARVAGASGTALEAEAAALTIARQSRHLLSFVERYRSIADLPEPALVPIDLAAFVADVAALAGAELDARGVAFAVGAPPAGAMVADPDLLRQALLNLLRNAGNAASAAVADPRVHFSCTRSTSELLFEVADNGAGVAPEHVEEMFVPFFTTKEGGAGIGLTLARQVALAHGGRLAATGSEGEGMTFVLALPGWRLSLPSPSGSRTRGSLPARSFRACRRRSPDRRRARPIRRPA